MVHHLCYAQHFYVVLWCLVIYNKRDAKKTLQRKLKTFEIRLGKNGQEEDISRAESASERKMMMMIYLDTRDHGRRNGILNGHHIHQHNRDNQPKGYRRSYIMYILYTAYRIYTLLKTKHDLPCAFIMFVLEIK